MFKRTPQPSKGHQLILMSLGVTAMLAGAAVSALDMLGVISFKQLHQRYLQPIAEVGLGVRRSNSLTLSQPSESFVKTLALMPPDTRSQSSKRSQLKKIPMSRRVRAIYWLPT